MEHATSLNLGFGPLFPIAIPCWIEYEAHIFNTNRIVLHDPAVRCSMNILSSPLLEPRDIIDGRLSRSTERALSFASIAARSPAAISQGHQTMNSVATSYSQVVLPAIGWMVSFSRIQKRHFGVNPSE